MIFLRYAAIRSVVLAIFPHMLKYCKYYRPRSHREEVAAFEDPRANGDSTLQFAFRDAFPLRELQASQPTGELTIPVNFSVKFKFHDDRSLEDLT
ncbi:hypothetical protein V1478_006393 [Vespula squamosa]|uniref:Uncharacterized protein n=1 Tax=Vespula squamosa TaxID=30214 RepID=A0ABD2B7R7_VESSQ